MLLLLHGLTFYFTFKNKISPNHIHIVLARFQRGVEDRICHVLKTITLESVISAAASVGFLYTLTLSRSGVRHVLLFSLSFVRPFVCTFIRLPVRPSVLPSIRPSVRQA